MSWRTSARADVAAGGEGAPFVPLYHRALARDLDRPIAVLNIGGVANVTWIGAGEDEILAFDTGPGNALIDDWMLLKTGRAVDEDGAAARRGQVSDAAVERFLADLISAAPRPNRSTATSSRNFARRASRPRMARRR